MLRTALRDRRRRWLLALGTAAAAVAALYGVRAALPPFLLAAVITYALYPAVDALHRRGLRRAWAILLVYALIGLLAAAVVTVVLPAFLRDLDRLAGTVPGYVARAQEVLAGLERRFDRLHLPPPLRGALDASVRGVEERLLATISAAVQGVVGLVGQAFNLLLAPVVAFYMLLDLPRFRRQVELWLPARSRGEARTFLRELDRALAGFVRGQLLVAGAVGTLTALALGVLGVPFAVVLGLLAAVTDLIPYFGPFLGAVPGVLLAGTVSLGLAVKAALAYVLIQQIEAAVLVPRIVGRTVGLHPLALIFALLVGGATLGLVGLILAVPAAGMLRVSLSFVLRWLAEEPGTGAAGGEAA